MALTSEELEKKVDDLTAQVAIEGYVVHAGNDIDRVVAERTPCPKCNIEGAEYYSFIHKINKTTRGFAACKNCGFIGEF